MIKIIGLNKENANIFQIYALPENIIIKLNSKNNIYFIIIFIIKDNANHAYKIVIIVMMVN